MRKWEKKLEKAVRMEMEPPLNILHIKYPKEKKHEPFPEFVDC